MCSVGGDASDINLENHPHQITEGPQARQCKGPNLRLYVQETKRIPREAHVKMIQDITRSN